MKTILRIFGVILFLAPQILYGQSPKISFESLLIQAEENPSIVHAAMRLAIDNNLPVSLYTKNYVYMQVMGIENGKPVYAVMKNILRPYDNGTTAFFDEIKNTFDPVTDKVNYGNGRITNPDWGVKKSSKKNRGVIEKSIMFVESTNDQVWILDYQTGEVIESNYISGTGLLNTPIQARQHPNGFITISDQVNDGVFKFDTSGAYLGVFAPYGGINNDTLDNVRGHTYRKNGHLLVANAKTGVQAITEFDTSGIYVGHFIAPGSGGLNSPWDILFRSDDILVSASSSRAIHRYDTTGNYIDNFFTANNNNYFPEQMYQLPGGRIAVADYGVGGGIKIYNSVGDSLKKLDVVTGNRGIMQLGNGNFITTNASGVYEIDTTTGAVLCTLVTGVYGRFLTLYEREGESYPIFTKSRNQINFGTTAIGSPVYDTLLISNTGDMPLIFDSIYLDNSQQFDFTGNIDTLYPNESHIINIMYDPSTYGVHNGNLVFIHNASGSPDTVRLAGSVLNAVIRVSDSLLTALVPENGTDSTTFYIFNDGMTPLTFSIAESQNAFTYLKKQRKAVLPSQRSETSNSLPVSLEADPNVSAEPGSQVTVNYGDLTAFGFNLKTAPDQFVKFDLTDPGSVIALGTVPQSFYAADFSTDGSVYYAVDDVGKNFGTIDTATGAFTVRGPLTGVTGYVTGMTVDPTDETIYITVTDGTTFAYLYTVNPLNGAPTLINTIANLVIPIDIAASPAGVLYSYDIGTDSLYIIDKTTAFGTAVAALDFNANYAQGMDFDPTDGVCYLASYTSPTGVLRALDVNTGLTTVIGPFPNHQVDGFGILKTGLPWVQAQPLSGTVMPGDSAKIRVYWYGKIPTEMIIPLDGYFHITSDDTSNPNIPVHLHLDVATIGIDGKNPSPSRYNLTQNYPNPFNPSTTIKYDIAKTGKVSLRIYNTLGQEVRTLVNKHQAAGYHSVVWDGKNNEGKTVSSGCLS